MNFAMYTRVCTTLEEGIQARIGHPITSDYELFNKCNTKNPKKSAQNDLHTITKTNTFHLNYFLAVYTITHIYSETTFCISQLLHIFLSKT